MYLSVSQEGLSTPKGKTVSFDDIHAILHSVDSGKPFKVQTTTNPLGDDQRRLQLQIQNCADVKTNTTNTGNDHIKRISKYYDSCALVKQLQSLDLSDESVVDQILTNPQPAALSELSAAHKNEGMIRLVAAKDGRIFSILAGQPAYSNWAGQYPIGFSRLPVRKLSDPSLAHQEITAYQNDALKKTLDAVCTIEDSSEFLKPAHVLHPEIYHDYMALIAEAIDLGTMGYTLLHNRYKTMAQFRRHVDLLEQNARSYYGKRDKSIAAAAAKVKSNIYRRLDELPAEPPFDGESLTQIRRLVGADDDGSLSAANTNTEGENDTNSNESQGTSTEKAIRSEAETEFTDRSDLILPLGRLCVARNSDAEEFIASPYIVVVLLEYTGRPLWLTKDIYNPVGLPDDKRTLLDFGGKYDFAGGLLAGHIDDWRVRPSNGFRVLNGKKVPMLHWPDVVKLIQTLLDKVSIFDCVENHQQAAAVIKKAWNKSKESLIKDVIHNSVVEDDDSEDRDCNDSAATSHMRRGRRKRRAAYYAVDESSSDETSGDWEPPSKRRR